MSEREPDFPDPDTKNVLDPSCARCPALVESRTCISWGHGNPNAAVVVIGEAPGAGDPDADRWRGGNYTGMAYTTRHSGQRARKLVADAGVPPEDCYFTNAVKCFPEDEDGSNREPTPEERANCADHLGTELTQVDPDVALATGKHATKAVLALDNAADPLEGFLDSVLAPQDCPTLGVTLLPVLHPSYQEVWLSRLGYDYEGYVADLHDLLADLAR